MTRPRASPGNRFRVYPGMTNSPSPGVSASQYGPHDLVDFPGLCRRLGRRAETVTVWLKLGYLPPPVRLSPKSRLWIWGGVLQHLMQLQDGQDHRSAAAAGVQSGTPSQEETALC